jgi:hypothetical protein
MVQKSLAFTPPITRVHNIFRIRTVVNAVTERNWKRKKPSDEEIGMVLAQTGLSKFRRQKIKDRIMRRARDHLRTASDMGLLTRTGRPLRYSSTIAGQFLKSYSLNEECPKDGREEAVFIDKIMRLKLTNVYDLQSGKQYVELRSRPCLFILHILNMKDWLHEHQIAVATGGKRCDPILLDKTTSGIVSDVLSYNGLAERALRSFYDDFGIEEDDRKNMTRNVRPLLDWCESTGLIESREVQAVPGKWYRLTSRGLEVLKAYGTKHPLWFIDLKEVPAAKSAVLLFYEYAKTHGLTFDEDLHRTTIETGLVSTTVADLVNEIQEDVGIKFSPAFVSLSSDIDFTFYYDVPPEERDETRACLKQLCRSIHLRAETVISSLETEPIEKLANLLQKEHEMLRGQVMAGFARSTAISEDPILEKVAEVVPSVGVLGQYRSDFEKEVALLLRLLGLNAIKYQGQLADRTDKTHVIRFFENNPDILIVNHIESLVECKSIGEWKPPLSGEKSVPKEILIYQQYFPEVKDEKSNSVLVIYEGSLDSGSYKFVRSILQDSKDIIFVTKGYLVNSVHTPAMFDRMLRVVKNPREFTADERILSR